MNSSTKGEDTQLRCLKPYLNDIDILYTNLQLT